MKVLDEKGRLFGKINLIDALVLLAVIVVAVGVIWKVFGNKIETAVTENSNVTLTYEVACYGVDNSVADTITTDYVGQLMSNGDLLSGYVVGCEREAYYIVDVNESGQAVAVTSPTKCTLRFTVVFSRDASDYTNEVGSQEVRVGKSHIVKTCDFEVTGTVTNLTITDGAPDWSAYGVSE